MNKTNLLVVFGAIICCLTLCVSSMKFSSYAKLFKKKYATPVEARRRAVIFAQRFKEIQLRNAKAQKAKRSVVFDVNEYTDLTRKEFIRLRTGYKKSKFNSKIATNNPGSIENMNNTRPSFTNLKIPIYFDWSDKGNVTGIKNQGTCGACWAFASVALVESYYARKYNQLYSLSEQQLIDCNQPENYACDGGNQADALRYLVKKGSIRTLYYPYTDEEGTCLYQSQNVLVYPQSFARVTNEIQMLSVYGPIAVSIDSRALMDYKSGIISAADCGRKIRIDHVVTLIGFGVDKSIEFWRFKNSWGIILGEGGYFRTTRGENTCGIAIDNYYIVS